jgi:hypothetical protein
LLGQVETLHNPVLVAQRALDVRGHFPLGSGVPAQSFDPATSAQPNDEAGP